MSIFDDESDRMKKIEVCALIPIIRKTLDLGETILDAIDFGFPITAVYKDF